MSARVGSILPPSTVFLSSLLPVFYILKEAINNPPPLEETVGIGEFLRLEHTSTDICFARSSGSP
jgi:hypothetical protein